MFDIETTTIASIMLYPTLLVDCGFEIRADEFESRQNQVLYIAVLELSNQNIKPTPTIIYNHLKKQSLHTQVDENYLSDLPKYAEPSIQVLESFKDYAAAVKLERFALEILASGKSESRGFERIAAALQKLQNFQNSISKKAFHSNLRDAILAVLEEARNPEVIKMGVYTPWQVLNDKIGFMAFGEIISIGARPGMGKTHMVVQMMEHSDRQGIPAGIVSVEMNYKGLGRRFIETKLQIPSKDFRANRITEEQLKFIEASIAGFSKNIELAYTPSSSVDDVLQNIRRMILEGKKFIVIDYLQGISFGKGKNFNLDAEIGDFYRIIKGISLSQDVIFVIINQLVRDVEDTKYKMPDLMRYFKGSGFIESHSDMIWSLWRPEYYGITEDANGHDLTGKMRVFGLKGRDGTAFPYVDLTWDEGRYKDKKTIDISYDENPF